MELKKIAGKYPLVMRGFLGFVLLWFGVNEILDPRYWSGYVPPLVGSFFPFEVNFFVQIHGVLLSLLALSLFFKFYIRYTGLITLGVLFSIIFGLIMIDGFTEIVVRDIGLFGLALAIWFHSLKDQTPHQTPQGWN